MKVTLLIPDLLRPPGPMSELTEAMPETPAMRWLLGRADRDAVPGHDICGTLCWLAGIQTLPAGALTALAAGDDPGTEWWLRADPVHLAADADGLRLLRGDTLEVTDDEAATLTVFLATQLGVPLRRAEPGHWYFEREPLDVTLHGPESVLGRRIESRMPDGPDGSALRSWLNETQMLLHAHPVNLRRGDHGQFAINSLWPWGGGALDETGAWPYAWTYSDEPVLAGLAQRHGGQSAATPRSLAQVTQDGPCIVRIDDVHEASRLGDVERWLSLLADLERDWFVPARQMLADGSLRELVVLDCAGTRFTLRPAMRWRFWRRARGLETD